MEVEPEMEVCPVLPPGATCPDQSLPFKLKPETGLVLDRQSTLFRSSFFICIFLVFEISKQIGNFMLTTKNNSSYPIPTLVLVFFIECLKLIIIVGYLQVTRCKSSQVVKGFSFKFMTPAVCYFLTNVIYLHALTLTSPPVWIILIQTRVLYTAAIYKLILGKDVTRVQIAGCVLIVASIFLTRVSEMESNLMTITAQLILFSQVSAGLSSVACLSIELFLKNDSRSFAIQQFWLYFWGSTVALCAAVSHFHITQNNLMDMITRATNSNSLLALLLFSILASSVAGLCVPVILKNLDSIVKDYLAALNNILLALVTAVLFPTFFRVNFIYGISLLILLAGITLYEKKTISFDFKKISFL